MLEMEGRNFGGGGGGGGEIWVGLCGGGEVEVVEGWGALESSGGCARDAGECFIELGFVW